MDFEEYQKQARTTDQFASQNERAVSIALLGFIGEIGSLMTTFKKGLRDGNSYTSFHKDMKEELGDILWYMTNIATKYDLSLDEIANDNLSKTKTMWPGSDISLPQHELYDDGSPSNEQIPRQFHVVFTESQTSNGRRQVKIEINDEQVGDSVTDNMYDDDGYRYHDAFHFAYVAILGWSPVVRKMLKAKRKSKPEVDEVQDGARAILTDEFISLYTYDYAKKHSFLEGTNHIDSEILRTIRSLTNGFEVQNRSYHDWRMAILKGYEVFRMLSEKQGGTIAVDITQRTIEYRSN